MRRAATARPKNIEGHFRRVEEEQYSSGGRRRPLWQEQAAKFSAIGLLNTLIDAVLYLMLTSWLGFGGMKVLAKTISYGAGIINSFLWNRSWTFRSDTRATSAFVSFVLASLVALAINTATMSLGLKLFNQYQLPALALATAVTLVWNFGISKFLVFRR